MKSAGLMVLGMAVGLFSASCAKKAPIASHPADPTPAPVAQTTPQAKQQPTQARATTQAKQQPASQQRSTEMPQAVRDQLNALLARMEDALFDYDKSTIRTDATAALQDDSRVVRTILADYPRQKLVIEGHCDERGSDEYNMALGDRRARAAEEFLVSMGVSSNQLSVISFGKERPVCTDKTEECYQKNRRAHLTAAP